MRRFIALVLLLLFSASALADGTWQTVTEGPAPEEIPLVSSGFTGDVHGTAEQWSKDAPEDVPALTGRYRFTVTRSPSDPGREVLVDWLGK